MATEISRRALGAVLASAAAAQVEPPKAPPPDELAEARAQVGRNREQLAKQQVPIALEPSFAFVP